MIQKAILFLPFNGLWSGESDCSVYFPVVPIFLLCLLSSLLSLRVGVKLTGHKRH